MGLSFFRAFKRKDMSEDPAYDIEHRISTIITNYEDTLKKFSDNKDIIEVIYKKQKGSEQQAKQSVQDLEKGLNELKRNLEEISEVLKINDKIKKYLFKPIKSAQNLSIIVTVAFGIIGLILTGPSIFGQIKALLYPSEFNPDYVREIRLENIKKDLVDGLYDDVIKSSQSIAEKTKDETIMSQALFYKAVARMLSKDTQSSIFEDIDNIKNTDYFIEGEKILLISVLHFKKGEYEKALGLLDDFLNNKNYENLWFEAQYYRFLISLSQVDEEEPEANDFKKAKVLMKRVIDYGELISQKNNQFRMFDLTVGKEYNISEIVGIVTANLNQIEKKREIEVKKMELVESIKNLKIAIRYNATKSGRKITSDKNVVNRARYLKDSLVKRFPELQIDIGQISDREVTVGGYGLNYYNWHSETGKFFWSEIKEIGEFRLKYFKN